LLLEVAVEALTTVVAEVAVVCWLLVKTEPKL
jgi:hypothetical protein